jgi:hypothetical protein
MRCIPSRFFKIGFFIVEICIIIWDFWVIFKIIACACWAYAETILSLTEQMRKRFNRTLSIHRTNFRVCSASGKMLTVFTCTICAEHTGKWFYRTPEHTRKWSKCWLSMFKSRISRPNWIPSNLLISSGDINFVTPAANFCLPLLCLLHKISTNFKNKISFKYFSLLMFFYAKKWFI